MAGKQKEIVTKAVEKTLEDILGKNATQIILRHMHDRCGITKENLPSKMEEFKIRLQQILGDGAKIIIEKIEQNTEL